MVIYIYDGSFDGLLTLIYDAYYNKEIPDKITYQKEMQEDFLAKYVNVALDEIKVRKVYKAIKEKISHHALSNIYYVYLSEQPGCEKAIYNYIRLGFKMGKIIDQYLSKDIVVQIHDLSGKVRREKHAMLGLIRFMELERGILYAKIQPKYNILSLVSPHFAERLVGENWVIHDVDRSLASIHHNGQWYITDLILEKDIEINENEKLFQSLWKNYFESISIKERTNLQLQKKNMPKRYWGNLIEKNEPK